MIYLAEELRDDFDLLTAGEQVVERYTCHSSHLHIVNDTHEFIQESQRQDCIFHTIHGQSATRLFIASLYILILQLFITILIFCTIGLFSVTVEQRLLSRFNMRRQLQTYQSNLTIFYC